jgi:hypothetical protein
MHRCRPCPLREQCQWHGTGMTQPCQVSVLVYALQVGSAPLLWQDWSRRAPRRIEGSLLPPATASPGTAVVILSRAPRAKTHVVDVIRRMTHGTLEQAADLLTLSAGGIQRTTACIERFHGTMRERLASVTRRSRHAARRLAPLEAGSAPPSADPIGNAPGASLARKDAGVRS